MLEHHKKKLCIFTNVLSSKIIYIKSKAALYFPRVSVDKHWLFWWLQLKQTNKKPQKQTQKPAKPQYFSALSIFRKSEGGKNETFIKSLKHISFLSG